ncbi:hypothetical protein ACIA3K_23075 [Micromonospora sp. NPDC051543]|uniref:hypothetical protein n=1 Tax=Micromonospora sp. NPDC051543 TaxID=3364287 RepID=UPI00379102EA
MTNEAEERTRRRRLVSRSKLEAQYAQRYHNPDVAAYTLAVREAVEAEIGQVDTWQRLADRIHPPTSDPDRASRARKQSRMLRKKLSRHFTAESKGPPWQTVMLVVKHAVPEEFQQQRLAYFAELYELARGEKPPTGDRPEFAAGTGSLDDPTTARALRQEIDELNERLKACMVEVTELRTAITARHLGPGPTSENLPRQRDPSTGALNARHFRVGGPVPGNHRAPRLDTGGPGLPGQSRGELPRLADQPWHGTDNLPRFH